MGRKILWISPEMFLQDLVTEGRKIPDGRRAGLECVKGLPENAVFVTAYFVFERFALGMLFESPDWPETPEGCQHNSVEVVMRTEFAEQTLTEE